MWRSAPCTERKCEIVARNKFETEMNLKQFDKQVQEGGFYFMCDIKNKLFLCWWQYGDISSSFSVDSVCSIII